jgi:hypothetical protein
MKPFRVIEIIDSYKVVLNCGQNHEIKLGDTFLLFGLTKVLKDPETGEDLEQAELIRGQGRVTHVQNKICTVQSMLLESSSSKTVKKVQHPQNLLTGSLFNGPTVTEEEIFHDPQRKRFDDIQIGDFARKI